MMQSGGQTTLPSFLYGTAWKEERTEALVHLALRTGFRGVDTANQRRHYNEAAVGAAVRGNDVFIQTKFTYAESQDHRLPYDPLADHPTQVQQSFESSIKHLGHVDSYLLHGPRSRRGLTDADKEVWRTMEQLPVPYIGASNVTAEQVETLCNFAHKKPAFVQNRCFAQLGWDREVRRVCAREGIRYQGFSLLTANVRELSHPRIFQIAAAHNATIPQLVFAFALAVGMVVLTGTTNEQHMREDLASIETTLTEEEIAAMEAIAG
ncbi:MAG TPA: aldo/keto reductase [Thermoanaerobaculia bacterium]|nr:aldo/keto reductase [Thermoanaerobaculia bacterium]